MAGIDGVTEGGTQAQRASKPRAAVRNAGCWALLLALPALCASVGAQQIYKSVDAEGRVAYSNQADPSVTQTPLALTPHAPAPPDFIHFCWTNCFTLQLDNGVYRRTDGTQETWTIERFAPPSFILHRHDVPAAWNGNSADVTYEGRVVDGRLKSIQVNGRSVPEVNMSWGAALDELPGSNSERDQRQWAQAPTRVLAPGVQSPDPAEWDSGGEVSTATPPPPLEDEEQPPDDADGYLWTPGYWGWGGGRYYWVPGRWVHAPHLGLLWTPGYWAYAGGNFVFHPGYWGPHVGYYGGINYGHGYFGSGYSGGRWVGNSFACNRSVNNLNPSHVHNVYSETVERPANSGRASYSGGPGGSTATPTAQDRIAAGEPHIVPTQQQRPSAQRAARSAGIRTPNDAGHAGSGAEPAAAVARAGATPIAHAPTASTSSGVQARTPARSEMTPVPATAADPEAEKGGAGHKSAKAPHS